MRSARPSTIAVLPTPGSPISTGLFLVRRESTCIVRRISSSRPITGSSLPSRAACGQVARVFLQRVIAFLGAGAVGAAALAHLLDGAVQILRIDAAIGERLGCGGAFHQGQRQQQALDGDETVAGFLRDLLRLGEEPGGLGREKDLARAAALDARQLVERALGRGDDLGGIAAGGADQVRRQAFLVVEQDLEQMLRRDLLIAATLRQGLCRLHESFGALGIFLEIHEPLTMNRRSGPSPRQPSPPSSPAIWGRDRTGPRVWRSASTAESLHNPAVHDEIQNLIRPRRLLSRRRNFRLARGGGCNVGCCISASPSPSPSGPIISWSAGVIGRGGWSDCPWP